MNKGIEISVVVANYNSQTEKIIHTLHSIIAQRNIAIEIIIVDDGSEFFDRDTVEAFLRRKKDLHFSILVSPCNQGTVKNLLNGIRKSKGEYVYTISPGDLLYDENTLNKMYKYIKNSGQKICFGNVVAYKLEDGEPKIISFPNAPKNPKRYRKKNSFVQKIALIYGWGIFGCSYLREREWALECISAISVTAKYVEDFTSSLYALVNGELISWLDINVVFYEVGEGLSTTRDAGKHACIIDDLDRTEKMLLAKYNDNVLKAYVEYKDSSSWARLIKLIIKHPIMALEIGKNRLIRPRFTQCNERDIDAIRRIICESRFKI